jgi:phosphoinositide-3-kinase regulatory subunit 4
MELSKMFPSLLTSLQKMDMFSVGVVLAELYLKGEVIFTYEQLLQYRRAEYDPTQLIKKIGDPDIEELVLNLIKPTPAERFTAQDTLQYFFDKVLTQPKH